MTDEDAERQPDQPADELSDDEIADVDVFTAVRA